MRQKRMYDELAHLWPIIGAPEDYAHEASFWRSVLRSRLGAGRHHILELGVGGGSNLSHLTSEIPGDGGRSVRENVGDFVELKS